MERGRAVGKKSWGVMECSLCSTVDLSVRPHTMFQNGMEDKGKKSWKLLCMCDLYKDKLKQMSENLQDALQGVDFGKR